MKYLVIVIILCSSFLYSNGQSEVNRDNELWLGLQIDKSINKKWTASFNTNHRRNNNFGLYKLNYYQFTIEREIIEDLKLSAAYRFIGKPQNKVNSGRLFSDLNYKKKIKPFSLGLRLRFQYDSENPELFNAGEYLLREKIQLDYKRKKKSKLGVYTGTEFFLQINNNWKLEKYRIYAGIKYDLSKRQKINLKYIYQKGALKSIVQTNIFSIEYAIKLETKKNKKKNKLEKEN